MKFARWVFLVAGGIGLLMLLPFYGLEARIGRDLPPPITHPEYYYGFTGVAVAWQVAFLVIGSDPARFRPLMLVGVIEKLSFGVPTLALFALGRVAPPVVAAALFDLTLGVLFVMAYRATGGPRGEAG
ncbi:hypothetical protein [Tautonia plasticadhaerens]|uniref:DoxX n=1 Tax=Tautonia plasticadhaerens TaxID=2527974 RepID=A0A518H3N0_9BACT|nr:hypothetical protein [Tautonia plasticadhaerens]QDV35461.1 hypothetical protein ElP_33640 [Tautonia plasticadhaerens]